MKEENRFYVYEWYIKNTDEVFYIGKGSGDRYKTIGHRNKFFIDMYNTHDCGVRIISNHLSEEDAFDLEKRTIKYYRENTKYRLTNICDGGEGTSGYKPTKEDNERRSIASKKNWQDKSFREKMMKIRNSDNSPYKSEEFRKKISSLVSGENNPNYGRKWSQEQKDHLSNLRKSNGLAKGIKNPKAKSIICLETGEVFPIIKDAMIKYKVNNEGSFTVALRERHKTAAGFHWLKYNEALLNKDVRFKELIISLSQSQKPSFICIETKEIFQHKKDFLKKANISVDFYNKYYDSYNGIVIDNKTYMLSIDYLSRFIQ